MINSLNIYNKYKNRYLIFKLLRFFKNTHFFKINGAKKKLPKVIQLPITYRCNSRCQMCNIWKMDYSNEYSVTEFSKVMQDDLFRKVETVGINGGEPTLLGNLDKFAEKILSLPSIKSLGIISHGFNTNRALRTLPKIYLACKKKGVSFHISISLDGYKKIHDEVRQIPNGFSKTMSTINSICSNPSKYCDSFDIGCTVVNQNVYHLVELEAFVKSKGYNIKYRLGIENKRIESEKIIEQYSVLYSRSHQKFKKNYNPLKQSAKEFFHYLMTQNNDLSEKFKYFSIFFSLDTLKPRRLLGCSWKDEGVTLDSRGELYYCAVASEKLGSLRNQKGEDIFFNKKNIKYRKSIIKNNCDTCIHDYAGKVEAINALSFMKRMFFERFSMKIYEYKVKLM